MSIAERPCGIVHGRKILSPWPLGMCVLRIAIVALVGRDHVNFCLPHLMHIKVQDEDPLNQALSQEHPGCDGHVIDDAEARAAVREGMVGAPGCVAGELVAQRQPGRQQRPCTSH